MKDIQFDYNSQRDNLIIPEYGRHVQRMIDYIKTVADKEERQAYIETVVELMLQIFPQTKNIDDYRDKVWKHIFRIADYDLDVIPPDGISIKKPDEQSRPEIINYPKTDTKYRHYGNNVQHLIDKAATMEDNEIRDEFIKTIGAYMKLAYKNWNKEHFANDEIIKQDIYNMSKGKLKIDSSVSLDHLTNPSTGGNRRRKKGSSQSSGSSNKKSYKSRRRS